MTDTERLQEIIADRGLKKNYIAKMLGITAETLSRKIRNKADFTSREIKELCTLLGIDTLEEKEAIFFAGK